jgi:hypothetical protein
MDDDNALNDQSQVPGGSEPVTPEPTEPDAPIAEESPEHGEEKPSLKEELREGAAKVFGIAVEVGSLLGGESGEIVSAEREIAEAEAEEFIDRIDGEG